MCDPLFHSAPLVWQTEICGPIDTQTAAKRQEHTFYVVRCGACSLQIWLGALPQVLQGSMSWEIGVNPNLVASNLGGVKTVPSKLILVHF